MNISKIPSKSIGAPLTLTLGLGIKTPDHRSEYRLSFPDIYTRTQMVSVHGKNKMSGRACSNTFGGKFETYTFPKTVKNTHAKKEEEKNWATWNHHFKNSQYSFINSII